MELSETMLVGCWRESFGNERKDQGFKGFCCRGE